MITKVINNEIEEAIVSFDIAMLLRKHGFEVPCTEYFNIPDPDNTGDVNTARVSVVKDPIPAPTLQITIEWIRVNFNLHIESRYMDCLLLYGYVVTDIEINTEIYEEYGICTPEEAKKSGIHLTLNNIKKVKNDNK